jgi:hypothetical protein
MALAAARTGGAGWREVNGSVTNDNFGALEHSVQVGLVIEVYRGCLDRAAVHFYWPGIAADSDDVMAGAGEDGHLSCALNS